MEAARRMVKSLRHPPMNCVFCGHFIDLAWEAQWNCFSYECAPWCRPCNSGTESKHADRQIQLMDAAIGSRRY